MKQNHPRGEPPGRSSRSSSPKRAENISPIQGAAPDTAVTNGQINRHDCTIFPAKLIRLAIIPYHGGSNPEYSGNNNNPNDHQKSYLQLYSVQQISWSRPWEKSDIRWPKNEQQLPTFWKTSSLRPWHTGDLFGSQSWCHWPTQGS